MDPKNPRGTPRRGMRDPPAHRGKPQGEGLPTPRHWLGERGELREQGEPTGQGSYGSYGS